MEFLNYSLEWARGEVFSAKIIALISLFVFLCALGFYLWGRTAMARAYWLPLAVSGLFLVVVAGGLYFANHPRITSFQQQYEESPEAFLQSELQRTAKSEHDLQLIVYVALPLIVIVCAVLVILLGSHLSVRAWLIVLMMLGAFLMAVDSNTNARNHDYRAKLLEVHQPTP